MKIIYLNAQYLFSYICFLGLFNATYANNNPITNNSVKFVNKFSYHNSNQKSPTQEFVLLDMGNGRTLPMPILVGEHNINNDTLIASIGMDYSLNDKLEVGTNTDFSYHTSRTNPNLKSSDKRLSDIGINAHYKIFDNHENMPNTNIYAGISLYDSSANINPKWLGSGMIGINTHIVNDPIIIGGSASYHKRRAYTTKSGNMVELGDNLALGGMIGFSVNPEISLNTGINWQLTKAPKQNGKITDIERTQTNLMFGLTYAMTTKSNLNANVRTNISGQGGSSFSVGITTQLGKPPPSLTEQYRQLKINK